MAKITEVRLTLAALIYGIEIDLKMLINQSITPFHQDLSFFHDDDLASRTITRFNKDNPGLDYTKSIRDVIDYIDFGDTFTILLKNETFLQKETSKYLKERREKLIELIPIRNRVMHTRPLVGGDFATIFEFVSNLRSNDPINWKVTLDTKRLIENDTSYVLTLNLPKSLNDDSLSSVVHNLPIPDFDETGFIGRSKDVEDVKQLILSSRVVSILGDGGVGKTALALKVAYDIVDMNDKSPFELVIWTTAKTTMLTPKGIEEIHSAITDYTGLIDEISSSIDENIHSDKLNSIIEYLELFKTLIIIDNLETIQSESVRDFIRKAQVKAHILITSRIGLGELEYPRKLSGLSESESARLLREVAKIRNSETLMRLPNKNLVEISEKLYFNPLALKWFVSTVEMGISPSEVLNNKENLLDFCLTNVFDKLGEGAISILSIIRASRRKLNTGEIIYLSDYEPIEVRKFLLELFRTTLINREIKDANNLEDVYYYIPDFAKDFLSKNHKIDQVFIRQISRKYKDLEEEIKNIDTHVNYNEFSVNALTFENVNQKIAAKFLSEALNFSKLEDYDKALQKVSEAKNIDSNYVEVYRVSAFIKATRGDILDAEEDYKMGLEISSNNIRLLFYYAQFLLFSLEEVDIALEFAQRIYNERPNHPFTALLFARCYNRKRNFEKANSIMIDLLKNKELDSKNKRVAYKELIESYTSLAHECFTVEKDWSTALINYKKAFDIYDECVANNSVDSKVISSYVNSLNYCMGMMPTSETVQNLEYVKSQIIRHEKQITLDNNYEKLILKYIDKFCDGTFNDKLSIKNVTENKVGHTTNTYDRSYTFIQCDKDSYFAHMHDFIDINDLEDWKRVKAGTLVSFEIGQNGKGEYAKNIRICN